MALDDMKKKQNQYRISKPDLIRVMVQALQTLDLSESATCLERESGIQLHDPPIAQFRQNILNGYWDKVMNGLEVLNIPSLENLNSVKFLIGRQKFLEALEMKNIIVALQILREEVAPFSRDSTVLHKLASLITCTDVETLYKRTRWDGVHGSSRKELINDLHKYIPASLMVPENRLEKLLMQAIEYQRENHMIDEKELMAGDLEVSLLKEDIHPVHIAPRDCIHVLDDHKDEVWGLQFSPDGRYLATCSADHTALIYDLSNIPTIWKYLDLNIKIDRQALNHFSDNQSYAPINCTGHTEKVTSIAWSPNGDRILTCSNDKTVKMWNLEGVCLHTFTKHKDIVCQVQWSSDGKCFITAGSSDRTFIKWSTTTFECLNKFTADYRIQDFSLSPKSSDRICAVTSNRLHVFNLNDHEDTYTLQDSSSITSVVYSPCGRYVLCGLSSNSSAASKNLDSANGENGTSTNESKIQAKIHLWDLQERRLVKEYVGHPQTKYVLRPCFSEYPRRIFVCCGGENGGVYVWNTDDGTLLPDMPLTGHVSTVNSVCWNPRSQIMASASDDGTVRVWARIDRVKEL